MENEPKLTQEIETRVDSDKKSRKFIYLTLAIILLGAGVLVYFKVYKPDQKSAQQTQDSSSQIFVAEKKELTEEQRKKIEAEIDGSLAQLRGLDGDQFTEDRDKLNTKLAGLYNQLGEYQKALDVLEKVTQGYKDKTARVWAYYIKSYRGLNDKPKGLEAANKALALDNENPQYLLAQIEFTENKTSDEIKQMFENALKKSDNDIDVVTSYAKYLEQIGDKPGAIQFWQKAGEIDDKDKATYDAEIGRLQK